MIFLPVLAIAMARNSSPGSSEIRFESGRSGREHTYNSAPRTAVITFSGLWNGIDPYTNYAALHRPIPPTYQPLLAPQPQTKPVDGGGFDVRIGWDSAQCSNHGLNGYVIDHTGDAAPNSKEPKQERGGGVMFALGPCAVTFSKPVEIPSLFWTFYEPATQPVSKNGTIAVFRDISDTPP